MKGISSIMILIVLLSTLSYALTTITVKETETAKVSLAIFDPDNDSLAITYEKPLDENGEWKTDYGDTGNYRAKVIVSDGKDTTEEELLIVVEKKEEKPFIEAFSPEQDSVILSEGDSVEFSLVAKDIDKDALYYKRELDGRLVGEENSYAFSPGYNESGLYALNVEVTDGKTVLSKGWLVKVDDTDRKPEFREIQDVAMNEGQKVTINLEVFDPDGDLVDITGTFPEGGNLEGNVFTWVPSYDAVKKSDFKENILNKLHLLEKDFLITFKAMSNNLSAERFFKITVRDQNRKPTIEDSGLRNFTEGDLIGINPNVQDLDGDYLTTTFSGWMQGNEYQSRAGDAGEHFVIVKASDGFSESEKEFKITVAEKEKEQFLGEPRGGMYNEGEHIKIPLDASVSILSGPGGAVIRDGYFEWTPDYDVAQNGEKKIVNATLMAGKASRELKMIIRDAK